MKMAQYQDWYGRLLENVTPAVVRVSTHHSWGTNFCLTGFIISPMLALLQIAFIRVYVRSVIMALVVVKKLHNGSRQLKEVINDLIPCCQ